ncbi:hypothetical protein NE237_028740 [Protea cynaroides]|uniref:THH1/TOM1/TOM3 domain-containing protein n=1 Tax=Protea cynaroides TaxID=273540 RepID=A0A9Q0GSL6_9MAGN|nr:hypothetical protein NE237_028740 [Protea cynaroides]
MASLIRMQRIVYNEDMRNYSERQGKGGSLNNWWDEINNSEVWQEYIFYALCAIYSVVSFVAFVQLIRIHFRVPEYGWTTQKVFHLMNFIVNGLRAILFGLYKNVCPQPKILLDLPGLLFFSTYTLLARSLPINKLRPTYLIINGVVYFMQVCIWIPITLSGSLIAVEVAKFYFSVISFVAALGFLIYGGTLFFMLRHFPIESRGCQKKLNEVGFVTGISCTGFLIRCFVVALSVINDGADLDVLNHPILSFIYYMIAEIIPSSLCILHIFVPCGSNSSGMKCSLYSEKYTNEFNIGLRLLNPILLKVHQSYKCEHSHKHGQHFHYLEDRNESEDEDVLAPPIEIPTTVPIDLHISYRVPDDIDMALSQGESSPVVSDDTDMALAQEESSLVFSDRSTTPPTPLKVFAHSKFKQWQDEVIPITATLQSPNPDLVFR